MRRLLVTSTVLVIAACASMQSGSGKGRANAEVPLPDLQIRQLSSLPSAASHVEGGIPVQYSLTVQNRAGQPITLKRVSVVSMGYGAYDVSSTTHPFGTVIQPAQTETVEFWVPANVQNASLVGANGPVTLRITAQFDSPLGQFQEVVVQQVNATHGIGQ